MIHLRMLALTRPMHGTTFRQSSSNCGVSILNNLRMQRHVDDLLIPVEDPSATFRTARVDGAEEAMVLTMSSENAVDSCVYRLAALSHISPLDMLFHLVCFFQLGLTFHTKPLPGLCITSYSPTLYFRHFMQFSLYCFSRYSHSSFLSFSLVQCFPHSSHTHEISLSDIDVLLRFRPF